jgi:cytochrome c oxidase cbb3-type subunit III
MHHAPMTRRMATALLMTIVAIASACDNAPGRRNLETYVAPDKVMEFTALYGANCAGCHGTNGIGGAALGLANPTYLAIASNNVIRRAIADGIPGTPMPAFARRAGGMLTDAQVERLVTGIRAQWSKPRDDGLDIPSYADASQGDPGRGGTLFATGCASCHGSNGRGAPGGSAIVDGSYLALVSNQGLRTTIIAGRPDLGAPDWRGNLPGAVMTSQDVADIVAWLAAQRPRFPGTPYERTSRIEQTSPIEVHP